MEQQIPDRIRIKDIAIMAGVSVGTVDRVLHNRPGVSLASAEKVRKILKEMNHQPNMYASALASNKKYHFVCLLPKHNEGEYWSDVEAGALQCMNEMHDFHITLSMVYYDQYDIDSFVKSIKLVMDKEPDGVILSPVEEDNTKKLTDMLQEKEIPYVFIDSNIDNLEPIAFFGQNSSRSGALAAKMLLMIEPGIKEVVIFRQIYIGRIGTNQQNNRELGFEEYMRKNHPDCELSTIDLAMNNKEHDMEVMRKYFERHENVTIGLTFNSKAYLISEYLQELDKNDFRLIGYDLLEQNVEFLKNGNNIQFLIAQQPHQQGYRAVTSLCDHLIFHKEVEQINYMPIDLLCAENIDYYTSLNK